MNSTISANFMGSIANQYANAFSKKALSDAGEYGSMSDAISRAKSEMSASNSGGISETAEARSISKEDMSLEEYRKYISDKITGFPLHPSQVGNSFSINISEVSLQKMKDDPEYEEWLLNDVKGALGSEVPGWYQAMGGPSTYCVLNYENGEKGCWCHMWSTGYKGGSSDAKTMFDNESKDSVYTRRADRKRQMEKDIQKRAQQKRIREKKAAEDAYEAKLRNREYLREHFNQEYYRSNALQSAAANPGYGAFGGVSALSGAGVGGTYEAGVY